jgi:hypothetical protein
VYDVAATTPEHVVVSLNQTSVPVNNFSSYVALYEPMACADKKMFMIARNEKLHCLHTYPVGGCFCFLVATAADDDSVDNDKDNVVSFASLRVRSASLRVRRHPVDLSLFVT